MNLSYYETIEITEEFPMTFHEDQLLPGYLDIGPHWHEHIELLYFKKGKGRVFIDSEPYEVEPGDLVVIPSPAIHSFDTKDGLYYDCLIVDWRYFREKGFDATENGLPSKMVNEDVGQVFDLLRREMANRADQYQNAAQGLVLYLLSLIYRHYGQGTVVAGGRSRSGKFDTIKEVMRYLKAHIADEVRIEDVAAHFGFSKYYFCRLFREVTGVTAVSYLNRARCVEARRLLRTTDAPIARIAERCGFENAAYFAKTYQRMMGCRPRDDRKKTLS